MTAIHVATQPVHRYQQKGEHLQEFNYEFKELIWVITNCEFKDIMNPLRIYMYAQKYCIWQLVLNKLACTSDFTKVNDYTQKIERDFLFVEGI